MKNLMLINNKRALLSAVSIFIVFVFSLLLVKVVEPHKGADAAGNGIEKTISDLKKITDSTNVSVKSANIDTLRNHFEFADEKLKDMEKEIFNGGSVSFSDISAIAESRGVYRARLQLSCQQFIEEKSVVLKVSPNNESFKYCLENWDFPTAYKLP